MAPIASIGTVIRHVVTCQNATLDFAAMLYWAAQQMSAKVTDDQA
jgi:hypothetical protein